VSGGEGAHRITTFDLEKANPSPLSTVSVAHGLSQGSQAAAQAVAGPAPYVAAVASHTAAMSQTEMRHSVNTLRCSGQLVACAGTTSMMSVLRATACVTPHCPDPGVGESIPQSECST
jgi:hypothetical protein